LKAKDTITAIVQQGLVAELKRSGFRKQRLSFARRRGQASHLIEVQRSSWNQGADGSFYVNVGVMFDAMQQHLGRPVPEWPMRDDCGFMVRMEILVADAQAQWTVDAQTDVAAVATRLARCVMQGVVVPLDEVTDLQTFEALQWQDAVPWGFPAYSAYLLGDFDRAQALVQAQAEAFHDRGVTYDTLIRDYRFTKLAR